MLAIPAQERVLCDDEILGTAIALLPEGYAGACEVVVEGRTSATLVFPDVAQAEAAAKFAVGALGGFFHATVSPSNGDPVTHQTWEDWAFESA